MSLKTFFSRSFRVTSAEVRDGVSAVFVENAHESETLTDVTIDFEFPKSSGATAEQTHFELAELAPGEKVELGEVIVGKNDKLTARCAGRVNGEDLDKENLVVTLED